MQTFFALDVDTAQLIGCFIGSSAVNTTKASIDLLSMINNVGFEKALILADKEHFTQKFINYLKDKSQYEAMVPVITSKKLKKIEQNLDYKSKWAGFYYAEDTYQFGNNQEQYRLIVQREGEVESDYKYTSFIILSEKPIVLLLSELYDKRWAIEEFFNFNGAIGFNRASTFNLNIRFAKMSLALLSQAATFQFGQKLPEPYKSWDSVHLSDAIFSKIDGDIRVNKDTIIVTFYNMPREFNLHKYYQNLPEKLEAKRIRPQDSLVI